MSGILAAKKSSGCCCRPQGCLCNSPNRPGAVIDRSFSTISVNTDINYNWAARDNGGAFGFCEAPCPCIAFNSDAGAGLYGYFKNGNRVYANKDDSCIGCQTSVCPGCGTVTGSASVSGISLTAFVFPFFYYYTTQSNSLLDQVVGNYSWTAKRVGYCLNTISVPPRIRKFCAPVPPGAGGGIPPNAGIGIDPNGAYISGVTGEYRQGLWGQTVGPIYIIVRAELQPPNPVFCGYNLIISLHAISYASMMDELSFVGSFPFNMGNNVNYQVATLASYRYFKHCVFPTDTVFGRYELIGESDYDDYEEDPRCGTSLAFYRLSISSSSFVEVT